MRLNKYLLNRVNNKESERGHRSVVWLKRSQPCLHHLHVLSTVFSWRPFSSFSLWIILLPPSLPPLILPLFNQCDGCLVPLAWGLMAGGRRFASHGGVTLSRGWPCQRWKPLDIPGTHLHSATQLLICHMWANFLGVEGLYHSSGKEKESCCLVYRSSTKPEIRHFHVVVVQRRHRNVRKSVMYVQSCCFAKLNQLLFWCSHCRRCCACLSSLLSRIAPWDVLGDELWPSFLGNLVIANERSDSFPKTVP